jgi:glutamate/tyrosine decarboxylase-like PLP-dependent enzyme
MPIDLSPDEFRRLGHRAVDLVADHLAGQADGPARRPVPDDERHALLEAPVPLDGAAPDALLDEVASKILRYPMGNSSPRFFAWVNSTAAPLAIVADLLASGLNPSVAGGDHAGTYIEHAVLRWMRAIVRLPDDGGGILTSGGSVANLIGLAVMRHVKTGGRVREEGVGNRRLVVYTSTEGHSCIQKAIEILGFGHVNLRRIAVDADWRMNAAELQRQIAADRATGAVPVCVAASAGTVNTGSIDPLDAIAALCRREDLWFHVDAAYGGPAVLVPAVADLYEGLEHADSVAVDPHKWMYMPVECGCALVRDKRSMRDAFSLVPPYLRDDAAMPWFSEFGIQQSRGFRALKLWMTLRQAGLSGYRDAIVHDFAMTRSLRQRLQSDPEFEIVSAGPLSVTCFRYVPPALRGQDAEVDRLNRRILDIVQQEGHVYLTATELHGRVALRACIVNFRTRESDVNALVDAVRSAAASAPE